MFARTQSQTLCGIIRGVGEWRERWEDHPDPLLLDDISKVTCVECKKVYEVHAPEAREKWEKKLTSYQEAVKWCQGVLSDESFIEDVWDNMERAKQGAQGFARGGRLVQLKAA